jgi:hypothetical protein
MDLTVLATGEENQEDGMNTDCDNAPHNIKGIQNQFNWWQSKEAMKLANVILHSDRH